MREKEASRILRNSEHYYYSHKSECSFHNWVARIVAFLEFGKMVWPEPQEKEIQDFYFATGYKKRYWGDKRK